MSLSALAIAAGCAFSNFTFFNIAEYPINVALASMICLTAAGLLVRFRVQPRLIAVALTGIGGLSIYAAFWPDQMEGLKSLGQIYLAIAFLYVVVQSVAPDTNRRQLVVLLSVFFSVHAALLVAQYVAMNRFNSFALQNPYGAFSPLGPLTTLWEPRRPYLPFATELVKRPNGLFSEPSVAAWATLFGLAALLSCPRALPRWRRFLIAAMGVGVFVTFTLTGWFMLGCVFVAFAVASRPRAVSWRPVVIAIVSVVALTGALFTFGQDYFAQRVSTVGVRGSSIDVRFVAPARVVLESSMEYPLGHPLGDLSYITSKTYLRDWADRQITGFDNGYYYIIYYFGVPGLIFVIWIIWAVLRLVWYRGRAGIPLLVVAMAGGATGAIFGPQFLLFFAAGLTVIKGTEIRPARDVQPSQETVLLSDIESMPTRRRRSL